MSKKSEKIKSLSTKALEKQKNILEMFKSHGTKIYDDLDKGQFPKFSIPSRSVNNIIYDKTRQNYTRELLRMGLIIMEIEDYSII